MLDTSASGNDPVQSGFSQGDESTSTPIINPKILWGAVAAATLGATLADWQRKREEEEARKRASAASQEGEGGRSGKKSPGRIAYEKKMQQKHIVGALQAERNEKAREKAEQAEEARQNLIAKNEDRAPVDMAKVKQLVEEKKKADLQAGLAAYYAGRKEGEENKNIGGSKPLAMPIPYDPPWLEKVKKKLEVVRQWTQDHVVQPVKTAWNTFTTTVKNTVNSAKQWVQDHVVQPVKNTVNKVVTTVQNEYQQYKTWKTIREEYGWTPIGSFSQKELSYFADTGNNIETKISTINGGRGSDWMDRYMSDVIIAKLPPPIKIEIPFLPKIDLPFNSPMTLPLPKILAPVGKSIILLPQNWENSYKDPKVMPLTHEFGHVWEISTGHIEFRAEIKNLFTKKPITGIVDGLGDDLNTFIGGDIVQLNSTRMTANTGLDRIPDAYEWSKDFNNDYGNNCTADYFAEGFDALINDPSKITSRDVEQWYIDVIDNETSRLP